MFLFRFLSVSILFFMLISPTANAEVILTLEKTENRNHQKIRNKLTESKKIASAISFLNDFFSLRQTIYINIGEYNIIWYQNNRIEIPYGIINAARKDYRHARFAHKRIKTDNFIENMLMHIIFHEFAHAVIDQYDIPVLGKEEDAADSLADVLLLHFFDGGTEIVASAADSFLIREMGRQRFSNEELAAEHSLGKQRYYQRLCHAYGSNPERNVFLKHRADFDGPRSERCIMQYHQVLDSWFRVLQPAFKKQEQ